MSQYVVHYKIYDSILLYNSIYRVCRPFNRTFFVLEQCVQSNNMGNVYNLHIILYRHKRSQEFVVAGKSNKMYDQRVFFTRTWILDIFSEDYVKI